jgi:hypothetical protein
LENSSSHSFSSIFKTSKGTITDIVMKLLVFIVLTAIIGLVWSADFYKTLGVKRGASEKEIKKVRSDLSAKDSRPRSEQQLPTIKLTHKNNSCNIDVFIRHTESSH